MCQACLYVKGRPTPIKSSTTKPTVEDVDVIKVDELESGDNVSIDQYKYWVKGRLPYTKGREYPQHIFFGGNICVDHVTGIISVHH